ncbi:MAG: hypothetical protein IPP74_05405 [Alphaproteobacteria bacterium]|nr:hypothetical protein [Alphaproteobacteria bacterium]
MFGISFSEFGLIALVAIIFIGPKELPGVIRAFRVFKAKLIAVQREFTDGYHEMLKDLHIDDLKEEVTKVNSHLHTIIDLEGKEQKAYNVEDVFKDLATTKATPTASAPDAPKATSAHKDENNESI